MLCLKVNETGCVRIILCRSSSQQKNNAEIVDGADD